MANKNKERVREFREREFNVLFSLYGNIFRSLNKIEGVTNDENDYLFRLLFQNGKVACARLVNEVLGENAPVVFSQFVEASFNRTNRPATIQLTNQLDDPFAPRGILQVDEDATIMYAFSDKMTPQYILRTMIAKVVEVEVSIRANHMLTRSNFWLNAKSSNTKKNYGDLIIEQIERGELLVFSDEELMFDSNRSQLALVIEQLQAYKKDLIGDILTFIGIDNLNMHKQERQLVDEVNANNNITNIYREMYNNRLQDFIERTNAVFGTSLKLVQSIKTESLSVHEEIHKEGEKENEENE